MDQAKQMPSMFFLPILTMGILLRARFVEASNVVAILPGWN